MKFATIRDLRLQPEKVWESLETENDVVLTSHGKPFAILTRTNEDSLEPTLAALRRSRAQAALVEIHQNSRQKGLNRLSPEKIQAEVRSFRKARRTAKPARRSRKGREQERR